MNGVCPTCQMVVAFNNAKPFSCVNCPECDTKLIVPKIFKNYQLVTIEEEFSVFKKYKGYDLNSDAEILLTILNKKFSGFRECFDYCKNESREISTRLTHSGVISILEYGEYDSTFYIAEPYAEHFKLSEYDCQVLGEFDATSVFNLFRKIASIIKEVHEKGFVHHNICLDNILLDSDGNVMLQNYFVSRVQYLYESANKEASTVSPFYISPEKADEYSENEKGDIFSLGVALYYLLTGKYPFDGETDEKIIYSRIRKKGHMHSNKIMNNMYKKPISVDTLRNDVAVDYSELISKMLQSTLIQRPTAAKFIDRLNKIETEMESLASKSYNDSFSNIIIPEEVEIKSEFKKAIEQDEFILNYQPVVELNTSLITGFEALLRWPKSPDGNSLPGSFIPNINDQNIIQELGGWVVDTACRQLVDWQNKGYKDLYVIINISPEQIKMKGFKETFVGIVKKYNLDTKKIIPELSKITSSSDKTGLSSECYEDFLEFFNSRISLEEITSEYKMLQSKIGKMNIHSLIIDNVYLKNVKDTETALEQFKQIIAFANTASIKTVAEKIETEEQAEFVKKIGCSFAQGFYFYKPMSGEEATELLHKSK
jgi:EAL domain-containing protein (putative c-di-GMP-specific phosphodiesterase class I)